MPNTSRSNSGRPARPSRPSRSRPFREADSAPSNEEGRSSTAGAGTRPRPHASRQAPPRPTRPAPQQRRESPDQELIAALPPIEVTIDRIVGEGLGIGFADGQTVFVPRTAPGDRVQVKIQRKQGKVLHAEIVDILEPSPMRIEERIPWEQSGGADLQHLAYADQLDVKIDIVNDSLRRIAKLDPVPDIAISASPNEWGYRSRAEFQVDHRNGNVGYFAPGSNRIIDVAESPVLTPDVQTLLTTLRDDMAAGLIPRAAREYRAVVGDAGSVLEPTATAKSRRLFRTVGEETFWFSAECFFQANIPVAEQMVNRVAAIADIAKEEPGLAIDLYAGVGLFTIPLARQFKRVIAVESFAPATKYAETNLKEADLGNTRVITAPVEQWVRGDRSPLGRVALVVFDPPRTGAGQRTIADIVRLKAAQIAAVSCDPATFARDIHGLIDGGYELVDVQAYDMFPQTHHVELIGHLRRR